MDRRLRILLAIPAYWPAHAFGGPVEVARGLVSRLVERGHELEVLTTTLTEVGRRPDRRTRVELLDGARVTPRNAVPLPLDGRDAHPPARAAEAAAPDGGARDRVPRPADDGRRRLVPGAADPLRLRAGGQFRPRLRKVAAQAGVRRDACPRRRDARPTRDRLVAAGAGRRRRLRRRSGPRPPPRQCLPGAAPSARCRSAGRGRAGPGAGGALRRPDRGREGHRAPRRGGTPAAGRARRARRPGRPPRDDVRGHRRRVGSPGRGPRSSAAADCGAAVRPLPARGRVRARLGRRELRLVAAEAASVGTPVVVSDRTGVAASFADGEALVVPYDESATVEAVARVLGDPALRTRLAEGALHAARRSTWDAVVGEQVAIYEEALAP